MDTTHPIIQMYNNVCPNVFNNLVQAGQISAQEQQAAMEYLRGPSGQQATSMFLNSVIQRCPQGLNYDQMAQAIAEWIQPLIQTIRTNMMRAGATWGGAWGNRTNVMSYMPGASAMGIRPNIGAPSQPRSLFQAPVSSGPAMPGAGQPTPEKKQEPPKKPAVQLMNKDWKPPMLVGEELELKPNLKVSVNVAKYQLSNGEQLCRVIADDPRIRYVSDEDVLRVFKPLTSIHDTKHKFLTVAYKRIKLLNVPKEEFLRFAQTLSAEVAKNGRSPETKIRTIIAQTQKCSVACMKAFTELILDEYNDRAAAGALVPSNNPKAILDISTLEGLLRLATDSLPKATQEILSAGKNYAAARDRLISQLIDSLVLDLPQIIINPETDTTTLDDLSRVLPVVWTQDGVNYRGTEDLFNMFIETRETINGSKSDGAVKAEGALSAAINEINRNFTAVVVHRIASWTNFPKLRLVDYEPNGNCIPTVINPSAPVNDIQVMLVEALDRFRVSKDRRPIKSPKTLRMECDEETYLLDYDMTTDDYIWVGSSRFWK